MSTRIGIDVGGTFTDFVIDAASGATREFHVWKTPTTRPDPSEGIFVGLDHLTRAGLLQPQEVDEVSMGTTIALNAILEGRGATTGMLVTAGFRDVLEIGRENRALLYDLQQEKLPVLVDRRLRLEVGERINGRGEVVRPLDTDEVLDVTASLVAQGVEAIAICFLHSYANPVHEQAALAAVEARYPELAVTASHLMSTDYREYERWLLAVLNAYVMPVMRRYVDGLQRGVRSRSEHAKLYLTHSAGGVMPTATAVQRPIQSAMSGPASGVLGAEQIAKACGTSDFITMDMGGTSCDVATVRESVPSLVPTMSLRGYVVPLRSTEVHSISAGGGTLAWVDDGGLLRVGPQSAGSTPGPAAYGRGGEQPTVTDAHMVLGHIDPHAVLGDSISLDPDAATEAVSRHVADRLGMPVDEAAKGILDIANASMVRAIEVVSVERGHDPRDFALIAYGGAAPLHASAVAAELGIAMIVVPRQAGVLCALGTLAADEYHERSRSVLQRGQELIPSSLAALLSELTDEVRSEVGTQGGDAVEMTHSVDVRYVGQTAYLEVPVHLDLLRNGGVSVIRERFEGIYEQVFGYGIPGIDIEVVAARCGLRIPRAGVSLTTARPRSEAEPRPWKAVFESGWSDCLLYGPRSLAQGVVIRGPAVIDTGGSSALVYPGQVGSVDAFGNLLVRLAQ